MTYRGDTRGNIICRGTANNFNADMAKAAKITIAEVEEVCLSRNMFLCVVVLSPEFSGVDAYIHVN